MGSRRHIFTTFAIFLLVREYGISVQTTATLFLVNSLVNIFAFRTSTRRSGYSRRVMRLFIPDAGWLNGTGGLKVEEGLVYSLAPLILLAHRILQGAVYQVFISR